jgi:cytochrome c oxidase subunit I+III
MLITMLGDMTAFVSLVFGYFFYFTVHADFPPVSEPHPGWFWSLVGLGLLLASWVCTLFARRLNRSERGVQFYVLILLGAALATGGAVALVLAPKLSGMNPVSHVYPAIVWTLVVWTVAHVALGVLMQLYCFVRRLAGRLTAEYDIDIANVALYWHFVALTAFVTVAVIAGFPLTL